AFTDDVGLRDRKLLEGGEHQLLLAHGAGVFDPAFFRKRDHLGWRFGFEVLEFYFPHWGGPVGVFLGGCEVALRKCGRAKEVRRSEQGKRRRGLKPDVAAGPMKNRNATTSACVWWDFDNIENQ